MRAAAATIVLALPSVTTPLRPACPTRPQKYHQIGWKQLVRLSELAVHCPPAHCNLTLNYLPSEHQYYYLSGPRPLRWYQRIPGCLRVRDVAEVREDQQGETQHEALAAGRTNFL